MRVRVRVEGIHRPLQLRSAVLGVTAAILILSKVRLRRVSSRAVWGSVSPESCLARVCQSGELPS